MEFRSGEFLVTSCYLNLDRAKMPPQMLKIRVKDLLQAAQQDLSGKAGTHAQRESLRDDFAWIEEFILPEIVTNTPKGMAIFCCSGLKFWRAYRLPRVGRNLLIADGAPYSRPLAAILAEYHRYGTVVVDPNGGRIYEVYMGELEPQAEINAAVPRRGREGGGGGRDERRLERRHDRVVQQHFQQLAGETFRLFKRDQFDWLILGGHREQLRTFKPHLHPYLQERWAGDFHCDPATVTLPEILADALQIEDAVEWKHEQELARALATESSAGRHGVSGISRTLQAIARGEAQTVLVEQGFEMPGYVCGRCH
jgi:peptide subunit release factor 1 (eRF1)